VVTSQPADPGVVRRLLDDLADAGGADRPVALLAPDVRWDEPGRNLIAGEYRGRDEVVGSLFRRLHDLTAGSFRISAWDGVVAEDDRAVAMYTVVAHRDGRDLLSYEVCVLRLEDGLVRSARMLHGDQHAWDRFWS
jgi:ketosteroid isomerase-like protein